MREKLVACAVTLAAVHVLAQGTVNFQNSANSLVRFVGGPNPGPVKVGEFKVSLLYQRSDGTFVQLGDPVVIGPAPGIFVGGVRTTTDETTPGAEAVFRIQAWSAQYETFRDALSTFGLVGESAPFSNPTGDPTANPPTPPAPLSGFKGVQIAIPEPRSFSLAAVGLGILLLLMLVRSRLLC